MDCRRIICICGALVAGLLFAGCPPTEDEDKDVAAETSAEVVQGDAVEHPEDMLVEPDNGVPDWTGQDVEQKPEAVADDLVEDLQGDLADAKGCEPPACPESCADIDLIPSDADMQCTDGVLSAEFDLKYACEGRSETMLCSCTHACPEGCVEGGEIWFEGPGEEFVDTFCLDGPCETPYFSDDCSEVDSFQCGFEGSCEDGVITIMWHEHAFCGGIEEIYDFSCSYECPGNCSPDIAEAWPADGEEMVELYCLDDEPQCPVEAPIGGICEGEFTCTYGEECCCGECYDSLVCQCMGGEFGCYYTDACMIPWCVEPPCCQPGDDVACSFLQEGYLCKHDKESEYGKCLPPVEAPQCWVNSDCAPGDECMGAQICPCEADCDMEDTPGQCQDPDELGDVGDLCGQSGGDCKEGLVCCYPCGIQGCQWQCDVPCDENEVWCAGGCPMYP